MVGLVSSVGQVGSVFVSSGLFSALDLLNPGHFSLCVFSLKTLALTSALQSLHLALSFLPSSRTV